MANNNGTACFNCNKAYMNCFNSCYNSPMKQGSAKVYCDGELYPKFLPRADVVEVRHGEWVEQIRDYGEYMETEGFKCSVCGYETMDNDKKYCSECGADMRGEKNGKE